MALVDLIAKGGYDIGPKLRQGTLDRQRQESHEMNLQLKDMTLQKAEREKEEATDISTMRDKMDIAKTKKERDMLRKSMAIKHPTAARDNEKAIFSMDRNDLIKSEQWNLAMGQALEALNKAPEDQKQSVYDAILKDLDSRGMDTTKYNRDYKVEAAKGTFESEMALSKHYSANVKLKMLKEKHKASMGLIGAKTKYYGRKGSGTDLTNYYKAERLRISKERLQIAKDKAKKLKEKPEKDVTYTKQDKEIAMKAVDNLGISENKLRAAQDWNRAYKIAGRKKGRKSAEAGVIANKAIMKHKRTGERSWYLPKSSEQAYDPLGKYLKKQNKAIEKQLTKPKKQTTPKATGTQNDMTRKLNNVTIGGRKLSNLSKVGDKYVFFDKDGTRNEVSEATMKRLLKAAGIK